MVQILSWNSLALVLAGSVGLSSLAVSAQAQQPLPWQSGGQSGGQQPSYQQPAYENRYQPAPATQAPPYQQAQGQQVQGYQPPDPYRPNAGGAPVPNDAYRPAAPASRYDYGQRNDAYVPPRAPAYPQSDQAPPPRYVQPYRPPQQPRYGSNNQYRPYDDRRAQPRYDNGGARHERSPRMPDSDRATYSENEVVDAGHRFFGSLSTGLAKAIQWAFKSSGRPNGYILGEDAGGAFVAGLRYGEGKLYTKHHGVRRVFWQGPSIGYDFGGDGNRTMTLVYNLRSPGDVYRRFAGVQGSAYLVGGASVQFLTGDDVKLAPIRTGVGLRLGANIGYLKFTRRPTWNPF